MKKSAVLLLLLVLLTGCGTGNSTPMPDSSSAQEESIHIQPEELLLSVGETASLVCQNASEQSVTDVHWTIEDENVATISSDGTVTAVAKGQTTAIAKRNGAFGVQASCPITIQAQKMFASDGAKIEISDKMENVTAQDGTNCTMTFEMQAERINNVFKGQAMLQSIGVKQSDGSMPAAGMLQLVSKVEFTLEPADSEKPSPDNGIDLAPLVKVDYRGKGTFRFIMTDVGFMALETEVTEDDMVLDIPFEVTVTGDKVGILFNAPDGQLLSFQGKLLQ